MIPTRGATTLLALLLAACQRDTPPSAPPTATVIADDAANSASLAGVAHDADATPADAEAAATWRLPGQFEADTGITWLQERFGADNVRIADVPGAEGEISRGVILFPDDAGRRAYLYFQDAQKLRGLAMIRVMDAGSRWRLDNGVAIGMPLSKLVAMNGKPIAFTGFDWDYGGTISDWNGGRLQPAGDDARHRGIGLTHGETVDGAYPMGDATYSSDDPHFPELGRVVGVGEINVSFPGEDDL